MKGDDKMRVKELCERLSLKTICEAEPDREINGAYTGDLLSWVMGRAKSDNVWITIMSNVNVVAVASLCDVSAVILAEGCALDKDAEEKAKMQGINIYTSELASYELCAEISRLI